MKLTERAVESRIRRALARKGMGLHKSRRHISADNLGGYQVVDIYRNCVVGGSRFDLTLDQAAIEKERAKWSKK